MLEDSLFPIQVVQRNVASLILLKYYVLFNWQSVSVSQIPCNLLLQWENTLSTTAYIKFACVLKLQNKVIFATLSLKILQGLQKFQDLILMLVKTTKICNKN